MTGVTYRPISRVDGGRPNSNQHVAVPDLGLVDVPQFQDLGGAVPLLNDRLHRGLPARSGLEPVVERNLPRLASARSPSPLWFGLGCPSCATCLGTFSEVMSLAIGSAYPSACPARSSSGPPGDGPSQSR